MAPNMRIENMLNLNRLTFRPHTSSYSTSMPSLAKKSVIWILAAIFLSACSVSEPSKGPQVTASDPEPSKPADPAPNPFPFPFPIDLPNFELPKLPTPRPLVALTITAPVDRAPANTVPELFELTFEGDVPADLSEITIFLNHNDVTGEMTVSGNKATATDEVFKKYIKEGVNTFTAEGKHVFFVYDTQPPRPVFTQTSASEGVDCQLLHAVKADENAPKARPDVTGLQQTVTGHVVDHSSTTSMSISVKAQDGSEISNKVIALQDDGSFNEQLDCGYFFEIQTEDSLGNQGTITYAAPGQDYDPSLGIQVNKSLFDFVLPAISDVMKSLGTSPLIDPDTPFVIPTCIDLGGIQRDCRINLRELSFAQDPDIIFELKDDNDPDVESLVIRAGADIPELNLDATLTLTGGTPELPPVSFNIKITKMLVAISPVLSTDDANALKLTLVDQKPLEVSFDIEIQNLSLRFFGVEIPVTGLANTIASVAKERIEKAVDENIVPKLKTALEDFAVPNIPLDVIVAWDNEVRANMAIDIAPTKLDSVDGNARIELAGNIHAKKLGETYRGAIGHPHLVDPLPTLGATTQQGKEYDLGIALPVNLLNQLFLSLHQTGLLQDFTLPFTFLGGLGEPFDTLIAARGIKVGDILNITIDTGSPLQVQLRKGELTDFLLYLDRFTFDIKYQPQQEGDNPLPPQQTLMKVTTDLVVDLGLGVTSDNYIGLSVDNLISMNLVSIESDFLQTGLVPLEEASAAINDTLSIVLLRGDAVTGGISKVVKDTIAQVVGQVTGLTLDLTLPDIGVVLREFGADETNSHLLLAIDLLSKTEIDEAVKNGEQLTFVLFLNPQNEGEPDSSEESSSASTQVENKSFRAPSASKVLSGEQVISTSDETIKIGESASIGLRGENPTPEKGDLEYRYRIDNGTWSSWKTRESINLYKMDLGLHTLEVCARTAMMVEAKDCQIVKLNVQY